MDITDQFLNMALLLVSKSSPMLYFLQLLDALLPFFCISLVLFIPIYLLYNYWLEDGREMKEITEETNELMNDLVMMKLATFDSKPSWA